jgi:hypothetical protein
VIITCKACKGTGRAVTADAFAFVPGTPEVCQACRGAGELVLEGVVESYVLCKACGGHGVHAGLAGVFGVKVHVCSACKGAGILQRPILRSQAGNSPTVTLGTAPRPKSFTFDVALSFAGEDRGVVEEYAAILRQKKLRVFLDTDHEVDLWGSDLYVKLDDVYRTRALFCVMFLSRHYAKKRWTNHERQSAQARAFTENKEYILPVRLDDTEIPGIRETVGYVDMRKKSVEQLAELTVQKVLSEQKRIESSSNIKDINKK